MERRLKILISAYAVDNNDVGEAHLTYHWINCIAEFADITLITMGSRINKTCGFEGHPHVTLKIAKPKLRFVWTGAFDRIIKPDYVEYYTRARAIAKELVRLEHFDVCHHVAPHSPRYPSPLHSLGVKFIVGPIHGGLQMPPAFQSQQLKSQLSRIFSSVDKLRNRYDPFLKKHYQSAHCLLISAPYVKDNLPAIHLKKCVVIPPQPPELLEKPPQREPSKKLRLIFVGRLIESKGVELAVKALANVRYREGFEFNIYGTGELEEKLKLIIEKNALQDIVHLRGFVNHQSVLKALHLHDVLLFPSLKEAWGLAVSEAMAAGLCVVCVDRGGPGYMIDEECGIKIPTDTPDRMVRKLTDSLNHLYENKDLVTRLGKNAYIKVHKSFTWPAVSEKLREIYSQ